MFEYKEYEIEEHMYNENKNMRLDKTYEMCVHELGLQQSKRDQIIAFYIGLVSFVLPTIININLNKYARVTGFLALYILGSMLAQVVVRYRIYKEIYWITCRTITQFYSFHQEKINKELVQHIFYKTMKKNASTVLVFQKGKETKVNTWKSYCKILNSAETILYEVLVLMSSLVLWVGIFMLIGSGMYGIGAATILVFINYIHWNFYYYKHLTKIYDVIIDGKDASFNATYAKAWFLHSF